MSKQEVRVGQVWEDGCGHEYEVEAIYPANKNGVVDVGMVSLHLDRRLLVGRSIVLATCTLIRDADGNKVAHGARESGEVQE